jgi:hypothetical protein
MLLSVPHLFVPHHNWLPPSGAPPLQLLPPPPASLQTRQQVVPHSHGVGLWFGLFASVTNQGSQRWIVLVLPPWFDARPTCADHNPPSPTQPSAMHASPVAACSLTLSCPTGEHGDVTPPCQLMQRRLRNRTSAATRSILASRGVPSPWRSAA